MSIFPPKLQSVILPFCHHFSKRSWQNACVLLLGAILCPGSRTVCNVLRCLGLQDAKNYHRYHRLLSRAKWSALALSGTLIQQLIEAFCRTDKSLVIAVDETIERRWGRKIAKRGIYRDAARSSVRHKITVSGLRWLVFALIIHPPWPTRVRWALPFLSMVCPSAKYFEAHSARAQPKKITHYTRQAVRRLMRWLKPLNRPVYLVADSAYAVFDSMQDAAQQGAHWIVRARLDLILHHFPQPKKPGTPGVQAKVGKALVKMNQRINDKRIKWTSVTFSPWYAQASTTLLMHTGTAIWYKARHYRLPIRYVLLKDPSGKQKPLLLISTCLQIDPQQLVIHFTARWQIEVTFAEVRRHLGVETQRQWSDQAIDRTTPVLMGLYSMVCLMARQLWNNNQLSIQTASWYPKTHFTFSDLLFALRCQLYPFKQQCSSSTHNSELEHSQQTIRLLWTQLWAAAA